MTRNQGMLTSISLRRSYKAEMSVSEGELLSTMLTEKFVFIPPKLFMTLMATSVRFHVPRYTVPLKCVGNLMEEMRDSEISQSPAPNFSAVVHLECWNHPVFRVHPLLGCRGQILKGMRVELLLGVILDGVLRFQASLDRNHHREHVVLVDVYASVKTKDG